MRRFAALIALALLGNAPLVSPAPPAALTPYLVDGKLKTDDFGWMRGAFDGASEQQKADYTDIRSWLKECLATAKSEAADELRALGVVDAKLDSVAIGPPLCGSLASFNSMAYATKSWEDLLVNERKAREVFGAYQYGARNAAQNMPYEKAWGSQDSWDLLGATVMDQVYRNGNRWPNDEKAPKLDAALLPYLAAHFTNAGVLADQKNTTFLKELVERKGWPSIPMVGERASFNAWLLVQHADHDPAFQLKALRLMEPLAVKGEVSKRNYAYLYDRVTLKLSGKQRFGTQFNGCEGDEYKLVPLEDEKRLDELRREYELEPISDYRNGMKLRRGPCPAT